MKPRAELNCSNMIESKSTLANRMDMKIPTYLPNESLPWVNSLFRRNKCSLNITEGNAEYKVRYLGNVQTCLAKGENCTDKPLSILWKNFQNKGAGAKMKVMVCSSGMKATTKQQGTTEYWAHRITYCIAHPTYPKVFCWIYRHEGKKMKVELRCHAVLCKKDIVPKALAVQLHDTTTAALKEFMREKFRRQNHRLTLGAKIHMGTTPRRKLLLSAAKNFKPPLEKSRSAPKLTSIDETPVEEEEQRQEWLSDLKVSISGLRSFSLDETAEENNGLLLSSAIMEEDEELDQPPALSDRPIPPPRRKHLMRQYSLNSADVTAFVPHFIEKSISMDDSLIMKTGNIQKFENVLNEHDHDLVSGSDIDSDDEGNPSDDDDDFFRKLHTQFGNDLQSLKSDKSVKTCSLFGDSTL